jgi:hypothetical protein
MTKAIVGVFCTGNIQGGQDRAFLFQGGLENKKAHYVLSWFKPSLEVIALVQRFDIEDEQ